MKGMTKFTDPTYFFKLLLNISIYKDYFKLSFYSIAFLSLEIIVRLLFPSGERILTFTESEQLQVRIEIRTEIMYPVFMI